MAIFNNQDPQRENNVGQFGATDESIGAYKQAAEYAKDAEYWAKISESGIKTIEDLLVVVEELLKTSAMQAQDIEDLKAAFAAQDARLMQLISQTNAAVADANAAIEIMDQKIVEVQKQLDILAAMYLTVNTLPPGSPATGSYNPATGEMILNIPEGEPGKDGSVKDLDTAPQGVPEAADWGFYVDKDDNTVHKALMSDIAKTFPSVTSVKVGTGAKETGDIEVTATKLGLGNVQNVASYSKTESDVKSKNFIKPYLTKADADTDAPNRQVGEKVLVWNGTSYDFYDVIAGATGADPNKLSAAPSKQEKRIVTVNLKEPDSAGNIDITVPTGNPSLYLGEMVMFPYDPAKSVSYPGVLPADGRVVAKTSAGDLGPSLVSGQLPVVSETEWQAGAKQYFSWGKLADGTTDADATNYIQIRLPDWTTGEAIRSPNKIGDTAYKGNSLQQIPYITTVNGQGPNDSTGAIVLTPAQLGAASSGANSDITSITGLTTALAINQGGTGANNVDDARRNLQVDSIRQSTGTTSGDYNSFTNPDKSYELRIANSGEWRVAKNADNSTSSLSLGAGGTGGTDLATARTNLQVDRIVQAGGESYLHPQNKDYAFMVQDTGNWGYYQTSTQNWRPLGVAQGGTGAGNAGTARTNLALDRIVQAPTYTYVASPAGSKMIIVDGGGVEFQNNNQQTIGLPVKAGGTGAMDNVTARSNLGITALGLGSTYPLPSTGAKQDTGFYSIEGTSAQVPPQAAGTGCGVIHISGLTYGLDIAGVLGGGARLFARTYAGDVGQTWREFYSDGNTTIDTNGFLKKASPVIKLKGDGTAEFNDQAEGATVERIDTGVYRVSGVLGFNSDPSWGGINGGFTVPENSNKLPLLWVDYEIEESGDIILKTYHREHSGVPSFASNHIEGVADGDPIDIPAGRWIDLRVEMPE